MSRLTDEPSIAITAMSRSSSAILRNDGSNAGQSSRSRARRRRSDNHAMPRPHRPSHSAAFHRMSRWREVVREPWVAHLVWARRVFHRGDPLGPLLPVRRDLKTSGAGGSAAAHRISFWRCGVRAKLIRVAMMRA